MSKQFGSIHQLEMGGCALNGLKNNDICLPEGGSVASPNISPIRTDLNSKDRN